MARPVAVKDGAESEKTMLSNETYNKLQQIAKKEYAPLLGKTYKHTPTGIIGYAVDYTLSGQLCLAVKTGGYKTVWASECVEVKE